MELYTWNKSPWMFSWMMIDNHCVMCSWSLMNNCFMVFNYWVCVNYCLMLNRGFLVNSMNYCWTAWNKSLRMSCWRLSYNGCFLRMYFLNVRSRVYCLSMSYCCCFLYLRMMLVVNYVHFIMSLVIMHILVHLTVRIAGFPICTCYIQ